MTTGTENTDGTENIEFMDSEGLKSIRAELENFKNIDKKIIDINGKSLVILGKNKQGKSSIIQAITSTMDSKQLPTKPIKDGEEHARISHTIAGRMSGEDVEYTIDIIFSPKNQKGRIIVYDKDGNQMKTPATLIKSLIGNVSFDPMKWFDDDKDKKLRTIKEISGCGKEVDMINIDIDNLKSTLKTKNDRADDLAAAVQHTGLSPEDIAKYSEPLDITGIQNEFNVISGNQKKWDEFKNKVDAERLKVTGANDAIMRAGAESNRIHAEIQRLQASLQQQQNIIKEQTEIADKSNYNIKLGEEWLNTNVRPSVDEVNARLTLANEHNSKSQQIAFVSSQQKEMMQLRHDADKVKLEIKKFEEKRSHIIENSQLPIKGLSYTDNEIFINGLPLEEGQINKSDLIEISIEIAIALNPKYKVVFIHDGSLFDKEHLRSFVKHIEERGYIVIIEMVAETEGLEIVFAENYL